MDSQLNQLLEQLKQENSFSLTLTDSSIYEFSQLTTAQLKELIKTVVDSPLTQAAFNTSATKVFQQSIKNNERSLNSFNVIDRLLFILQTRIVSLSPDIKLQKDKRTINVNLQEIFNKLQKEITNNSSLFQDGSEASGRVELTFGVPSLLIDQQINEELYKDATVEIESIEQLRKIIGEAFVNEIAKAIKTIKIDSTEINFETQNFKTKLKIIESLPASLTKKVIEYIEKYKEVIDKCLVVEEQALSIDGTLFSTR